MKPHQIDIIKKQLIPMIVKDITPLLEMVIKKRLELFADEIIKNQAAPKQKD